MVSVRGDGAVVHSVCSISLDDRDGKVDAVYEQIETGLELIGASAVEDKLQDGVADTIANLSLANINLWVLTGDKQGQSPPPVWFWREPSHRHFSR